MKGEDNADFRGRVLEIAMGIPGAERDEFLITILATDEDAGVRSRAARLLGQLGSEKSLAVLVTAAKLDRTTDMRRGDVGMGFSARRDARFAIAELAAPFPGIAKDCATALRDLPVPENDNNGESLADARLQALYQVTRDESLLAPFHARLASDDPAVRERGVVAFRFLKLKSAPPEIVKALQDRDNSVRLWAALVLGEIGDPKTIDALAALAADVNQDRGMRCNAISSLGRMKAMSSADLMEKLLDDPEVSTNAAIALFQISGRKVKQFPPGYDAR